jgi:hypothetical protein
LYQSGKVNDGKKHSQLPLASQFRLSCSALVARFCREAVTLAKLIHLNIALPTVSPQARPELLTAIRTNYRGNAVIEPTSMSKPVSAAKHLPARLGALGIVMEKLTPARAAQLGISGGSGVRDIATSRVAAKAGLRATLLCKLMG